MFLGTDINSTLGVANHHFQDHRDNIDWLQQRLQQDLPLYEKMELADISAKLCEKFHSYFHFQQSYLHLQLAKCYYEIGYNALAAGQLQLAVVQDPLNEEAVALLMKIPQYEEHYLAHKTRYDLKSQEKYDRQYDSFSEFLCFVTPKPILGAPIEGSYWHCSQDSIAALQQTISLVKHSHSCYHQNAANIYYNRHLLYKETQQHLLASNDLIRASNLDKTLFLRLAK